MTKNEKIQNETQVFRINLNDGGFATISNEATYDSRLSSNAYRLLIFLLNNSKEWITNTTYFANKLKWAPSTLSRATKNLEENGYLIKSFSYTKGKKGRIYSYQIFEQQSLNKFVPIDLEVTKCKLQNVSYKMYVTNEELTNTNSYKNNLHKTKAAKHNVTKNNIIDENSLEIKNCAELLEKDFTELKEKAAEHNSNPIESFHEKVAGHQSYPIESSYGNGAKLPEKDFTELKERESEWDDNWETDFKLPPVDYSVKEENNIPTKNNQLIQ